MEWNDYLREFTTTSPASYNQQLEAYQYMIRSMGPLYGKGVDYMIIDDPIAKGKAIHSQIEMQLSLKSLSRQDLIDTIIDLRTIIEEMLITEREMIDNIRRNEMTMRMLNTQLLEASKKDIEKEGTYTHVIQVMTEKMLDR